MFNPTLFHYHDFLYVCLLRHGDSNIQFCPFYFDIEKYHTIRSTKPKQKYYLVKLY